jgi:general secretion pathway protein D
VGKIVLLVLIVMFAVRSGPAAAQNPDIVLYAQDIPASDLVGLLYRDVFRKPFVTSPQVQANRSVVSVHIAGSQEHAVSQARDYLAALGFAIVEGKDVDRVELPVPPAPEKPPEPVSQAFFYTPKWRTAGDLSKALSSLFPEARFSGSAGGSSDASEGQSDKLVVHATVDVLAKIKALVPRIDTPVSDLVVKAAVYEVGTDGDDGSGFQLAVSLLGGQLDIGFSPETGLPLLGSFLSFKSSSIEAVMASLSKDGRFKVVTAPTVRARSGSQTKFYVGESVPVLGSVSYPEGGGSTPVQSVEYRDAGVIFSVLPVVQENVITVDLSQEISDFVKTTTGVNNTPTLTRRSLDTTLSLEDGDVIMLGGLTKTKDTDSREGFSFLPDFLRSNRVTSGRTDLLLILQVQRLPNGSPEANMAVSASPVKGPRFSPQVVKAIHSGQGGLY